jgi:hypothetical protein
LWETVLDQALPLVNLNLHLLQLHEKSLYHPRMKTNLWSTKIRDLLCVKFLTQVPEISNLRAWA